MSATCEALVIGFNRPRLLLGALDNLRDLGVHRVFVGIDGPRAGRPDDAEAVQACRDVAQAARSHGPIELLVQEENLGCRRGVATAISWFLEKVGEGAIIEDDVRVSPAFLAFAAEGLARYRDEPLVGMVSGYTPLSPVIDPPRAHLTWYGGIWGWATWAENWRAWPGPPATTALFDTAPIPVASTLVRRRITHGARLVELGLDTWDYSWDTARVLNGWLCATPSARLTTNVGFNTDATHTSRGGTPRAPIDLADAATRFEYRDLLRPQTDVDEAIVYALDRWYGAVARRIPRRLRWRLIEFAIRTRLLAS